MSISKTALITGASRGLGRALTLAAAARGFHVFAGVRDISADRELKSVSNVQPLELDVTNPEQRMRAVRAIQEAGGRLDLLIHNAGINSSSRQFGAAETQVKFGSLTEAALLGVARTNAVAPLLFTQELAGFLQAAGEAKVIAISSWFASIEENGSRDYNYGYSGSKALLNAYFRLAANALKTSGTIAFMANPGWMRTDMGGERAERSPEESASAILNLADKADKTFAGTFMDWNGDKHPW